MKRCIELAKLAEGRVSPNPPVGAVVLDKDNNFVAEGFHRKYGEAHAEVNALNSAGEKARGGTLYISLEPCCHHGKTPPCVDKVIESGIKILILGMTDPNPEVAGKGIQKAREAGIEVIEDVLNKECRKLNEIFIKNIIQKKPFIAIKTASTMDGKIATSTQKSKWITSQAAREEVHRLRNKYDAIISGSATVIADNPGLTTRIENGRSPVRVIVDSKLITPANSRVYSDDGIKVIIATSKNAPGREKYPSHVEFLDCPLKNNKLNLEFLANELYKKRIFSIIAESGGKLNGAFLKQNLVDKIYFFLAPKLLGDHRAVSSFEGFAAESINQCINLRFDEVKSFSPDLMIEGYPDDR